MNNFEPYNFDSFHKLVKNNYMKKVKKTLTITLAPGQVIKVGGIPYKLCGFAIVETDTDVYIKSN